MRISDWSSDVCSSDLPGVLDEVEPHFLVDDHLDGDGAAHAFFGGRGDGFVVGVGVQAVAVVEQGVQGLQGGADVVELDLLRVQGAAAGLDVVRSEEHTSELQSLMRISYAVFCLTKKNT